MSRVLVVEDSVTQALEIQLLLEEAGFEVEISSNGLEAMEALQRRLPDLVLTDFDMPGMDGLELVETLRREHASVPVVVVTQYGTEEIAVRALRNGAANYVPKRNLARDIVATIDEVLVAASANFHQDWVLECMSQTESRFVLDNNEDLIPPLISHLQQNLRQMNLCDENTLIRVAIAVNEALTNAIQHGNLDVSSVVRDRDEEGFFDLIKERRGQTPYRDRRVHLSARESRQEAVYVIRDEGAGFDLACLGDPTDPPNVLRVTGRGLLLIRSFMDEVHHNESGNQITMIKRRAT